MRARTEFDLLPRAVLPIANSDKARNPEITSNIKHPHSMTGLGKLFLEIGGCKVRQTNSDQPPAAVSGCTTRLHMHLVRPTPEIPGRWPQRVCCLLHSRWSRLVANSASQDPCSGNIKDQSEN